MTNVVTRILSFVLGLVPAGVRKVCELLHLPADVTDVVEHIVLVFASTFASFIVGHAAGFHGTVPALVYLAGGAGLSAVWHYVDGLIPPVVAAPVAPPKPAPKKAAAKKAAAK